MSIRIERIHSREILDSRGNPTIEVELTTSGGLGEVLPTTHFIRLTRGIMLRGAEIGELMSEMYYLIGFTLVAMTMAALRFTKRLD